MLKEKCMKNIFDIAKKAESRIAEHKADKTLEHPIDADMVKTEKAMAYEEILSEVKLYAKEMKKSK